MRAYFRLLAAAFLAVAGLSPAAAQLGDASASGGRLALVIGNARYPDATKPLNLPEKNAVAIAEELRRNNFDVDLQQNLGKEQMRAAIDALIAKSRAGSAVFLFFSGYGIQAGNQGYLIPVDAQIWTEADVRHDGVSVESVLTRLEDRGARPKIVVLDASRRNPFERRFRSFSSGLGAIEAPSDSLIISAAAPGKVIADSEGETSIFVSELLKEMRSPGLSADEIFEHTRLGVTGATHGEQVPWVASSLHEGFHFAPALPGQSSPTQPLGELSAATVGLPRFVRAGTIFRDCPDCPELVVAPAGQFNMGSDDFETEAPIHPVTIARPFAVGRGEVTFAQWDACVDAHGCDFKPDSRGARRADLPVTGVSWNDAKSYVEWLSRKTGQPYRLPSEAEWEYAARAGTTTPFWWGSDAKSGHANCRDCGNETGRQTLPIGSFPANRFGLFDTSGNAAEWVEDCWADSYRGASSDATAREAGDCKQRVVRGGSFDSGARYLRSAARFLYDAGIRYYANGFRIVRDLP